MSQDGRPPRGYQVLERALLLGQLGHSRTRRYVAVRLVAWASVFESLGCDGYHFHPQAFAEALAAFRQRETYPLAMELAHSNRPIGWWYRLEKHRGGLLAHGLLMLDMRRANVRTALMLLASGEQVGLSIGAMGEPVTRWITRRSFNPDGTRKTTRIGTEDYDFPRYDNVRLLREISLGRSPLDDNPAHAHLRLTSSYDTRVTSASLLTRGDLLRLVRRYRLPENHWLMPGQR